MPTAVYHPHLPQKACRVLAIGETRYSIMDRSPCLKCSRLHENKNNPTCDACKKVKDYDDRMGPITENLPIEMTDMGNMKKAKSWSIDDEQYLKDNYLSRTTAELAEELNRTVSAVYCRLNRLKLRRYEKREIEPAGAEIKKLPSELEVNKPTGIEFFPARYQEPNKKVLDPPDKAFVILDFSGHPDLYDRLITAAAEAFRTPDGQMLYLCNEAMRDVNPPK